MWFLFAWKWNSWYRRLCYTVWTSSSQSIIQRWILLVLYRLFFWQFIKEWQSSNSELFYLNMFWKYIDNFPDVSCQTTHHVETTCSCQCTRYLFVFVDIRVVSSSLSVLSRLERLRWSSSTVLLRLSICRSMLTSPSLRVPSWYRTLSIESWQTNISEVFTVNHNDILISLLVCLLHVEISTQTRTCWNNDDRTMLQLLEQIAHGWWIFQYIRIYLHWKQLSISLLFT